MIQGFGPRFPYVAQKENTWGVAGPRKATRVSVFRVYIHLACGGPGKGMNMNTRRMTEALCLNFARQPEMSMLLRLDWERSRHLML